MESLLEESGKVFRGFENPGKILYEENSELWLFNVFDKANDYCTDA